jgi:sec-independent protein translocase protein TatC
LTPLKKEFNLKVVAKEMSFKDHISELRKRLTWSLLTIGILSVASFVYYTPISTFFLAPFNASLNHGASINVNSIYEGFFVKIKLSMVSGFILSLPMIVFQLCRFILPGLNRTEKKWVMVVIVCSSILSIASTYLGYAIVFPTVMSYLLTSQFVPENINILLNYHENLRYIISFLTASILIFQSPIVLCFLLAKNCITRQQLLRNARWFIIGILVASAVITPPDIFSQLSLSIPLIGAFFCCLLIAKLMHWGNSKC